MPLLAAPLTVLLRRRGLAFAMVLAASWIALAISVALWLRVADERHDLLCDRQLAAAVGHRVPRRPAQRVRAGARVGHRGGRASVQPRQHRDGGRAAAALPLLHDVRALPGRPAGHHDHRRRLQHLRVPRGVVALDLRADRARARPARARGLVPVPDHGHDRRDLHRHRHRLAVPDDGHAEPGRHGPAPGGRAGRRGRSWRRWPS